MVMGMAVVLMSMVVIVFIFMCKRMVMIVFVHMDMVMVMIIRKVVRIVMFVIIFGRRSFLLTVYGYADMSTCNAAFDGRLFFNMNAGDSQGVKLGQKSFRIRQKLQ